MDAVRRNHLRSGLGEVKEMSIRGVTIIFSTSAGGRTNVSALRMSCGFQLLVWAATGCTIATSARRGALSVDRLGRTNMVMRSSGARRGGAGGGEASGSDGGAVLQSYRVRGRETDAERGDGTGFTRGEDERG